MKRMLAIALMCAALTFSAGCGGTTARNAAVSATPQTALPDGVRIVQVAETTGEASVYRGDAGDGMAAVQGMNLSGGDGFGTGPASDALLGIDGDKTIRTGPSVRMKVASLVGNALRNGTVIELDAGTALFRITRKLEPGETFEVSTPTCVMGVRGTRFFVTVTDGVTRIGVFEGLVEVSPVDAASGTTGAAISVGVDAMLDVPEVATSASAGDLKAKPLSEADIPAFITTALKREPEGVNPRWINDTDAEAPSASGAADAAANPAGEGTAAGIAGESLPGWNLMDGVALGTPLADVQRKLGMEGAPVPDQPQSRMFVYDPGYIVVMTDADDRLTAYTMLDFPLERVTVPFTAQEWVDRLDLDGQPLSAAEAAIGRKGQLSGKWSAALLGEDTEEYVWLYGDGVYLSVEVVDGVISSLGMFENDS